MALNLNFTGTSEEGTVFTDSIQYIKIVDFIDAADLIYVGEAIPGTTTSSPSWRIKKIDLNSGADNDITIQYADGDSKFNNIWDDHLSLTYS